jgi:hypothetical protein
MKFVSVTRGNSPRNNVCGYLQYRQLAATCKGRRLHKIVELLMGAIDLH